MQLVDQIVFSDATVGRRIYHCGFKIDDSIFSIGGQGPNGKIYDEFIEIDVNKRSMKEAICDVSKVPLPQISSAAMTPVFYTSKMGSDGALTLNQIAGEINWGEALELIKYEGFYMFGGRKPSGKASNDLYVLSVTKDKKTGRAKFQAIKPETQGKKPPARYSHTLDYVPRLSVVVIYGGRNDNNDQPILDDLWVIKLYNMEYLNVRIGGQVMPTPRCSHCSFVNGTEMIICGGQGEDYKLMKDI